MNNHTLFQEAQALELYLFGRWDDMPHHTLYAARLVAVAERAHQRRIRRAARCGDMRSQRWLALIEMAVSSCTHAQRVDEGGHDLGSKALFEQAL